MHAKYDNIGINYSVTRCTDPIIATELYAELKGATRILNIGAGAGSYEPDDVELIAVEPSAEMISQRKLGSHAVVKAFAEKLPFESNSFSHAMTVNSMHHWQDRALAFNEINRIAADKFVAITWDPASEPFWLTRDYFPEIYEMDKRIFPAMEEFTEYFDDVKVKPLKIPGDCKDGLLAAFWKRPAAYLSSQVRQSTSPFAKIKYLAEGLKKLEADLADGTWARNNQVILNESSLDVGYRLITANTRHI
ncbi:MAG: class I SAM-dependent methyltransferase [Steroidobacter sp.]